MEKTLFTEIALVLALGAVVSLVMRIIKQPLIIGYIFTGLIASPALLGIVHDGETLESFSTIGISLLLFIVGLGLNPKALKDMGFVAGITGITQVVFSTLAGYAIMTWLGRSWQEALVVGVALAFSSTIVGLKLLNDKKEHNRLYGRLAIGVLLVQDVVATLSLVVISASGDNLSVNSFGWLILKGLMVAVPLFIISSKLIPKVNNFISSNHEFLFLFALAWGFGVGTLFQKVGFSLEVGSLIAGVALAANPFAQEVGARLKPLRDFFIIVFFIYLGSKLGETDIIAQLPLALLFSAMIILTNPIAIMIPLVILKHTKLNAFRVGMIMAQVSEFSLIFTVLAAQKNLVGEETVGLITLIALITIAISSYMITYSDQLYHSMTKLFPFMRNKVTAAKEKKVHLELVLFGYKKGGGEFIKLFEKLGKRYAVIDYDPEVIENLERKNVPHIFGDATDIELLEEANIEHAKLVVSVASDHATNMFLLDWLSNNNPGVVFICSTDNFTRAIELYEKGASYVLLPYYISSEKISSFILKSELHKSEFNKYRQKHLEDLEAYFSSKKHQSDISKSSV
jgi:Kef-type K+ transport system membrane component KefB